MHQSPSDAPAFVGSWPSHGVADAQALATDAFGAPVLAALFDAMPDGAAFCRLDYQGSVVADCTVLYANPALHTLTGLRDLVGQRFAALFPEGAEPQQTAQTLLAQLLEPGTGSAYQHYRPTLDCWFSVVAYQPRAGHAMLQFRDVSSRHRVEAQQSMAAAEHYAEWILDSVGEGLCRVDEAGVVTFINPVGAGLLGYQPAQMVGKNAHLLFHHSHADGSIYPEAECKGRFALQKGQPHSVDDEVFWRQDGSCFAVHYVSAPMRVGGHMRGTVLTFRDTSEETAIRQALLDNEVKMRQTQDLLNKLADQVPGALFQFRMAPDGSFSIPFASQGMVDIFGVTPEQVRQDARLVFAAIPLAQRQAVIDSILKSARALENWVEVFPVQLEQRGAGWVHAQSHPEVQADGSILWHGFVTDATERMQARAQLLDMNETLESRVQARTRELVMALDAAEMAKTSRGQFLANMSHEIRTPMNTVMGMSHLALKTQPPPQMRHYLEKIQQSGAHLLNMINDILDFSKIDAGKMQLELGAFALEPALQHIIQLSEGRAIEKGLRLQLELEPAVPQYVRADALRLSQILLNFLNNAIKFTERGGVLLRVRSLEPGAQAAEQGSCLLRFEVADTGIGVDPEQGQRLFKSFEQGDNSTTRKFGGTGLGLAISSQLATLMWGSVGVTGQLGVGSTFWLEVRLELAAEPAQEPLASLRDLDAATQALCGKRVLVVDDNDFNLDVARGLLQDAAMEVVVARDGAQAVQALLRAPFDCVLMDVQMPVMDGLEATRRIRSTPALVGLPVIAMTANAGAEDRANCLAAGMNEVIVKPVDPDDLFLTLARWMGAVVPPKAPPAALVVALPDLSQLPVWDALALTRMLGNNLTAHARLLEKYRVTASETVAALQLAADAAQWAEAADQAHKLKSSSRAVGAMRLGGLCEALERAGRSGDGALCSALVGAVQQGFAEVDALLSA